MWTSSNPGVATVDGAGRLSGRTHGSTTLTATFEGRSASKTVNVVNNYAGTWSGTYVVRACTDSGVFRDGVYGGNYVDVPWCQALEGVGSVHSIVLTLTQTGSHYSEIGARSPDAATRGSLTGTLTADGGLSLEGTFVELNWYGEPWGELDLSKWATDLDASGGMTGRWSQNLTMIGREGNARQEVEIVTMTRVPSAVLPVSARAR